MFEIHSGLKAALQEHGSGNLMDLAFYLAISPKVTREIVTRAVESGHVVKAGSKYTLKES